MRLPWKRQRPRVVVTGRRYAIDATSQVTYEITPETFSGPWKLPVGTVLEVVGEPRRKP